MSHTQIVFVRMPDGERIPMMIDAISKLPVISASVYALVQRRLTKACNTMVFDLRTVSILRDWAADLGIDLDQRLRTLSLFSAAEVNSLVQTLRCSRRDGSRGVLVGNQKWQSRIDVTVDYFSFETENSLACLSLDDSRYSHARRAVDELLTKLKSVRPRVSIHPRLGLHPELRSALLAIAAPDHPENPWSARTRPRNYALVLLFCLLGLRLGEVLNLKLSDLHLRGAFPTLDVRRREGDPTDPRAPQPVPKTLGRRLPVSPFMARVLDQYLLNDRLRSGGGRSSPFVFLSDQGAPLAPRTVGGLFAQLRQRHPRFGQICAHQLRNTFNDLVLEALKESPLNRHQARDLHAYACGWVPDSEMPARYGQRWLLENTEAVLTGVQRTILREES